MYAVNYTRLVAKSGRFECAVGECAIVLHLLVFTFEGAAQSRGALCKYYIEAFICKNAPDLFIEGFVVVRHLHEVAGLGLRDAFASFRLSLEEVCNRSLIIAHGCQCPAESVVGFTQRVV